MLTFSGIMPANILPFAADLSIDEAAYRRHLRWLADTHIPLDTGDFRLGQSGLRSRIAVSLQVPAEGDSRPPAEAARHQLDVIESPVPQPGGVYFVKIR